MSNKNQKRQEWEEKIVKAWQNIDFNDKAALHNLTQLGGVVVEKYAKKSLDIIEPHSLPSTRNLIFNVCKSITNKKILDAGCGPNPIVSIKLAKKGNKLISIDISKGIVRTASMFAKREKLSNIDFVLADLKHLPFKNNYFDIIICSDVIEHISQPVEAIDEIRKIIKRNGEVLFTIPNRWSFVILLAKFKDILEGKKKSEREYYISPSHLKEYTYPEIKKLLKNKLVVSRQYTVGWEGGWKASLINKIISFWLFRRFSSHIVIKCKSVENF